MVTASTNIYPSQKASLSETESPNYLGWGDDDDLQFSYSPYEQLQRPSIYSDVPNTEIGKQESLAHQLFKVTLALQSIQVLVGDSDYNVACPGIVLVEGYDDTDLRSSLFASIAPGKYLLGGSTVWSASDALPESSTQISASSNLEAILASEIKQVFRNAQDEVFADGMDSRLSHALDHAVKLHGTYAVNAIERVIRFDSPNAEIVGETLRQIGWIDDPSSQTDRLRILIKYLDSSDPRIRDAASLGIAALDDPAALPAVRKAMGRERSPMLHRNLELVVEQLQETQWQVC